MKYFTDIEDYVGDRDISVTLLESIKMRGNE